MTFTPLEVMKTTWLKCLKCGSKLLLQPTSNMDQVLTYYCAKCDEDKVQVFLR